MFRIGEFSKLTQVTVRMLRYYDETGLLRPAKTDRWTGYRMYSVEQIPRLNKIIYLRDSGFHIEEIAAALQADEKEGILVRLEEKYQEIEKHIQSEQEKLRKIQLAKEALIHGRGDMHYNVALRSIPSFFVLSLRRVILDYYGEGELWEELSRFAKSRCLDVSGQTFSIYHDEDYRESQVDVELCVPVKKAGEDVGDYRFYSTPPVPVMAATMVRGEFSNIAGAYQRFARWLQENSQYKMAAPSRQIVHRGPWNEDDPEKYLTEIQIPLIGL